MADLEGFDERYPLNSRLVKQDGTLVEEVYRDRRTLRQVHPRDRPHLDAAIPVCDRADGGGAARADQVLRDRRDRRPRGLRHRLGAGPRFTGRHHQRVRRGLHGRARHEGRLGSARLLRQPGEDGRHPQARRRGAVVRGPHALGRRVQEAGRPRRLGQRHRRRHRNRRFGSGDAGRHQPAERPDDPRAARQQVGLAVERQPGLRQVHAAGVPPRVRLERRRSRARREVEQRRQRADDRHARGDRPRLGPDRRAPPGQSAGRAEGAVLRAGRIARRSRRALLRPGSQARRARAGRRSRPRRRSSAPSTRATRATRWSSCAASAKGRRSKKTTCATAR